MASPLGTFEVQSRPLFQFKPLKKLFRATRGRRLDSFRPESSVVTIKIELEGEQLISSEYTRQMIV